MRALFLLALLAAGCCTAPRALELENARLRGRLKLLEDELAWARQALDDIARFPEVPSAAKVPAIATTVSEVRPDGRVRLAVGLLAGVDERTTFVIYRGTQFVAKVVVDEAVEDSAIARVLFVAPKQAIRDGDSAATRLD